MWGLGAGYSSPVCRYCAANQQTVNITLFPQVSVKQDASGSGLVLEATNARIRGSELVENLQLDQK